MKLKSIFLAGYLGLMALSVSAQERLTEENRVALQERQQEFYTKLKLNAEQEKEMDKIQKEFKSQAQIIVQSSGSRLNKGKRLRSIQNEKDKKVKKVLTPEQFEIYKQEQEKRKKEWKENRNN